MNLQKWSHEFDSILFYLGWTLLSAWSFSTFDASVMVCSIWISWRSVLPKNPVYAQVSPLVQWTISSGYCWCSHEDYPELFPWVLFTVLNILSTHSITVLFDFTLPPNPHRIRCISVDSRPQTIHTGCISAVFPNSLLAGERATVHFNLFWQLQHLIICYEVSEFKFLVIFNCSLCNN